MCPFDAHSTYTALIFLSPQVVQERLLCRGIVGDQGCYEHIMSIDVSCRFVAPVLSISSKRLNFYMEKVGKRMINCTLSTLMHSKYGAVIFLLPAYVLKVPGNSLMPLYEKLNLKNVSALSLSMELSLVEPFSLCEEPRAHSSATTKVGLDYNGLMLCIYFSFHPWI